MTFDNSYRYDHHLWWAHYCYDVTIYKTTFFYDYTCSSWSVYYTHRETPRRSTASHSFYFTPEFKVIKIGNVYIEVPANFKKYHNEGFKINISDHFLCTLLVACTEDADVQNIVSSHQNTWKSPLSRTIENPITTPDFKRTYGVGFSYDGLHGELCNLKDIKSQVLDYQK